MEINGRTRPTAVIGWPVAQSLSPAMHEAARRSFTLEEDRSVSVRAWLVLDRLQHELGLENACLAVFGAQRGSQIFDALSLAATHGG